MLTNDNVFKKKTYFIVGVFAKNSLAFKIAKFLMLNKARVIIADIYNNIPKEIIEELKPLYVEHCNIYDDFDILNFFINFKKKCIEINGFIYTLGFMENYQYKSILEMQRQDFMNTIETVCFTYVKFLKHLIPYLIYGSSCISFSSLDARQYVQNENIMAIARSTLEHMIKYTLPELNALGIRNNIISCSPYYPKHRNEMHKQNPMINKQSTMLPDIADKDIFDMIEFLFSNKSRKITGEIINLDAGNSMLTGLYDFNNTDCSKNL